MLWAIALIATWEGVDYLVEQARKAEIKALLSDFLHGNSPLPAGGGRVENDQWVVSVTPLATESPSFASKYYVEAHYKGSSTALKYHYDARSGKLAFWKRRQEFGWNI